MWPCPCMCIAGSDVHAWVCSNTNSNTLLSRCQCLCGRVFVQSSYTTLTKEREGGGGGGECSHGSAASSMMPSICLVAPVKLMRWVSEGGLVEAEVSQKPALPARLLCCETVAQGPTETLVTAQLPGEAWHTACPSATHQNTAWQRQVYTVAWVGHLSM